MTEETNEQIRQPSPKKRERKSRRAGQKVRKGERKFLLRIFLGRDANGKRLYHNEIFLGTSKQADDQLNVLLQRQKSGEPLRLGNETFAEFVEEWLNTVKLRVREDTAEQCKQMVKTYLIPSFGALRLVDVTSAKIEKRYTAMKESGLSQATVLYPHTLLTNIFDLAIAGTKCDAIR